MVQERSKVTHIKEQIEQGEYRVDHIAVADALLSRLRELAVSRERGGAHPRRPLPVSRPQPQIQCS
jgi:hypothetical protein